MFGPSREERELEFKPAMIDRVYELEGIPTFDGHYLESPVRFKEWVFAETVPDPKSLEGTVVEILCQKKGRTHIGTRLLNGQVVEEQVILAASLEEYDSGRLRSMLYTVS